MDPKMNWTVETYRLDEIGQKFNLPCVVHVNEGYYSKTDAEGFSQGDILSIDSKMVLHKVAANFSDYLDEDDKTHHREKDYVELKNEILVPFNYKGKLKVLKPIKYFEVVRELAAEFPRYAKVIENLKVTTEKIVPITVEAGTVIELIRIDPGSTFGKIQKSDKLIIQFKHSSGKLTVSVPFHTKGKFRTEPDNNEYTIKEAIDRYSLPQHVRFEDDKIKRVYSQNLLEGIENMCTVTETLRLNRLVTQNVLVGHYKPLEGSEQRDTDRFRKRTLVVFPMDSREICELEVNVLKEETDDLYEEVLFVRNSSTSDTEDIVDSSLYIDFAMMPGIKTIPQEDETSSVDDRPPRPPKSKKVPPAVAPKPILKWKQQKGIDENSEDDNHYDDADDIYIIPDVKTASKSELKLTQQTTMDKNVDGNDDDDDDDAYDTYILPDAERASKPELKLTQQKLMDKNLDGNDDDDDDGYDTYILPDVETVSKPELRLTQQKVMDKNVDGNDDDDDDDYDTYILPDVETGPKKVTKSSEKDADAKQPKTPEYPCAGVTTPSPTSTRDMSGFSLADMNFTGQESGKRSTLGRKSKKLMSNLKKSFRGLKESAMKFSFKSVDDSSVTSDNIPMRGEQREPLPASSDDEEEIVYDDIDESKIKEDALTHPQSFSKTRIEPERGTYLTTVKNNEKPKKPTELVQQSYDYHPNSMKLFHDLNNEELVERLNYCGLQEMADFCKKERLNGSFFQNLKSETLREEMNLKGIQLAKFIQMRDKNWVPM